MYVSDVIYPQLNPQDIFILRKMVCLFPEAHGHLIDFAVKDSEFSLVEPGQVKSGAVIKYSVYFHAKVSNFPVS